MVPRGMEEDDGYSFALGGTLTIAYASARRTPSVACTNLSSVTNTSFSAAFTNTSDSASPAPAQAQIECYQQGVPALVQPCNIPHKPRAYARSDGDAGKFTWFLFG